MEGARRGRVGGEGLAVTLNEEGRIYVERAVFQILTLGGLVCGEGHI